MASITVTSKGDDSYKKALKKLAHRQETDMATLVRKALDAMYGEELASIIAVFFANDGSDMNQLDKNKTKNAKAQS